MNLETFKKLPLGGVDRRAMVSALAERGPAVATALLAYDRSRISPAGTALAKDSVVLVLGGSNGITRALAEQLLFGEKANVYAVHFDSEKMQIGAHHVRAMQTAADAEGLYFRARNDDATKPAVIDEVVAELKARFRAVHVINGIASGATKRYAEHGAIQVKELDVVFDPVLQVPDFSSPSAVRKVGLVDVEVATHVDIERTNKFMGTSTVPWVERLAEAGMVVAGESIVAFCDYDFEPDDPVYGHGPLAGAKRLQRESMKDLAHRFGVRTARLCYPPVATTALGAIPGGLLMFALSAEIMLERGTFRDLPELARGSMRIFEPGYAGEDVRLDDAYVASLPEFHVRKTTLGPADLPRAFQKLCAHAAEQVRQRAGEFPVLGVGPAPRDSAGAGAHISTASVPDGRASNAQ